MATRLTKIRLDGIGPVALAFTSLTAGLEYEFVFQGGEMIFIRGAGACILESVADPSGRLGDLTYMNSDASNPADVFGPFSFPGWRQSDGTFKITAVSGTVSLSVVSPAR